MRGGSDEEIGARLSLKDRKKFSDDIKKSSDEVEGFGDSSEKTGSKLKTFGKVATAAFAAVSAAVVGGGALSVKAFADFDQAMNKSVAIMDDVSDAMREDMSNAAREVAKTTTFSAGEAAESYFFLASAGLDAEQQIAALPQVAAFAQAGMFDMARATDLATDAQSALGLASEDAEENLENLTRVTDVFVKANTLANTSVEQIAEAFTAKFGSALNQANKEVEEGAAVLSYMADQGVKGAEAGNALTMWLQQMSGLATKNADEFEELGIAVFDADGNMRHMADIVEDFEVSLGDMTDAERTAAMESLGLANRLQATTGQLMGGSDAIRDYEEELKGAGGTVQDVAAKQLETFWAQLGLLKDQFMDVAIEVGSNLVPHLMTFVEMLQDHMPAIQAFIERGVERLAVVINDYVVPAVMFAIDNFHYLQEAFEVIRDFVVSTVIPAIQSFGETMADVASWTVDNWDTIRPILIGIGAVIATLLIPHYIALGVQATISAARSAAAWVVKSTAALRHGAMILWTIARIIAQGVVMATRFMASAVRVVAGWVLMGTQALLQAARMAAAWFIALGPIGWVIAAVIALVALIIANWDKVVEWTRAAWDWVVEKISSAWNWIRERSAAALAAIVGFFVRLRERATDVINRVMEFIQKYHPMIILWNLASEWGPKVVSFVTDKLDEIISFIKGVPGKIRSAARGMFDGIKDAFRNGINWIIDKWNNLEFTLGGFSLPGWMGGGEAPGFTVGTPNIPRLHTGGTVTDSGAVNIRPDEEIITLPVGAGVVPLEPGETVGDAISQGIGGGGGTKVIQVVLDRKVLAEAVYDETRDEVARR